MNKKISIIISAVLLILGIVIGYIMEGILISSKVDFKLNGSNEINIAQNKEYVELGAKLVIDDVDYSNEIKVKYYLEDKEVLSIDTTNLVTYYAIYQFNGLNNNYNLTLTRKINIVLCDEIEFHFLMLGNKNTGDSIYIKAGETDILIDAGSRTSSASTIIDYVDDYCLDKKLEYVIATHADKDHIAAFSSTNDITGIFDYYEVDTIIDFGQTNKQTKIYNDYVEKRDEEVKNGAIHYKANELFGDDKKHSNVFEIANGIKMTILEHDYYFKKDDSENNYSVVTLFTQLDNNYLLTGDLEKDGEQSLIEKNPSLPEVKLYKAGHHGSDTSSNDFFIDKIKPEIIAVTCVAGTDEYTDSKDKQFPTQKMIDNVKKYTELIYVTTVTDGADSFKALNGNIVVSSDGIKVDVNCSYKNTILKDTDWFKENRVW